MENIQEIKKSLHDTGILAVLAYSQYMPTDEKMAALAERCMRDTSIFAYGYFENEKPIGAIVLRELNDESLVIESIAVHTAYRGKGIGRKLVTYAAEKHECRELCAETDDDAVNFYRKCGFTIMSLGEKYTGVIRYLCRLTKI